MSEEEEIRNLEDQIYYKMGVSKLGPLITVLLKEVAALKFEVLKLKDQQS